MNPLTRFSTRAESYAKYRPGYPSAVIDLLTSKCELSSLSTIADVGSGTGILSEMFLKEGSRVFGVEPNEVMRLSAEKLLKQYSNFISIDGTAEATTLLPSSVDFVSAAQAFHWFRHEETKAEFQRILKPDGWIVLVWNERQLDTSPFLSAYEKLLLKFGTDYSQVRHENVSERIEEFFAPAKVRCATFDNAQHFDFASLKGRVQSASYTPEPEAPHYELMMSELKRLFDAHAVNNTVSFLYTTRVFYGRRLPLS